jgi:hypothetical protein
MDQPYASRAAQLIRTLSLHPPSGWAGRSTDGVGWVPLAAPAAIPVSPITRCRTLSSVLTGTMLRIESPSPTMNPQIATAM